MPSSKKASPPAIVSSLRQSSADLNFLTSVVKWPNTISPIDASLQQVAKTHGERLVVIVLADEDNLARPSLRVEHRLVVLEPWKRRLLDQHVLSCVERAQCQIQMKPRRHRDDHGVHTWIGDRLFVARIAALAAEAAAELLGFVRIPARVAANDLGTEPPRGGDYGRV